MEIQSLLQIVPASLIDDRTDRRYRAFPGGDYQVIGFTGGDLFDPFAYDMFPEMLHTACDRGFFATYKI
jgi:hypothetical protein